MRPFEIVSASEILASTSAMARRAGGGILQRVGRRIADARRARGLTQERLAGRLRITTRNLQRIESGQQNLTLETLDRVAGGLGLAVEELLHQGIDAPFLPLEDDLRPCIVPIIDLAAAAGALREPRSVVPLGWTLVYEFGAQHGFVARVEGASMEPTVPSGALSLFRATNPELTRGRVLLLQHRAFAAPDDGGSYLLKRVGRVEKQGAALQVELVSDNASFKPLVLVVRDADELVPVAEWVRVVHTPKPAEGTRKK